MAYALTEHEVRELWDRYAGGRRNLGDRRLISGPKDILTCLAEQCGHELLKEIVRCCRSRHGSSSRSSRESTSRDCRARIDGESTGHQPGLDRGPSARTGITVETNLDPATGDAMVASLQLLPHLLDDLQPCRSARIRAVAVGHGKEAPDASVGRFGARQDPVASPEILPGPWIGQRSQQQRLVDQALHDVLGRLFAGLFLVGQAGVPQPAAGPAMGHELGAHLVGEREVVPETGVLMEEGSFHLQVPGDRIPGNTDQDPAHAIIEPGEALCPIAGFLVLVERDPDGGQWQLGLGEAGTGPASCLGVGLGHPLVYDDGLRLVHD